MLHSAHLTALIPTTNPEHAKSFYRDTLGLHLVAEDPYALVFDSNAVQLRVQIVEKLAPQSFTVLGWNVPDVRKAVAELSRRGVAFERYSSMEQDDLGVWEAPSGAGVAWFKDPDGNVLSLTQGGRANQP